MKETNEDKNWELITKHIGNELSPEEEIEFNLWLSEDAEHRKELEHAETIWQLSSQKEATLFGTDTGWNKLHRRIAHSPVDAKPSARNIFISITRIAATILILMVSAYAARYFINKTTFIEITAETRMVEKPVILPDGTKVFLNTGARLVYPKKFGASRRTVDLSGEAYFDVSHNKEVPFIISMQRAEIKVLGTSFNVIASQNTDSVQVAVTSGIVELTPKTGAEKLLVKKGKTGVYFGESQSLRLTDLDINTNAWVTNQLIFNNSGLMYVMQTLEHLYGEKIIIDNENIKNCRLTADFKDKNLVKILKAIEISQEEIKITKTKNGYLLTGPGC